MSEGWRYYLDFNDQTFELADGEQTVGRSRTCDVSIDDPSVSRRHVCVKGDVGRILLQDLGSSNGTFINGERVEAGGELHDGDALGLGDADLKVRVVGTSAFETVRMSAHPLEQPGEATLFLQRASEKLASEAMEHDWEEAAEAPSHMAPAPLPPVEVPSAPPVVEMPGPPAAVAVGAQSVLDQTTGDPASGDLLPSLDGFDITMGPEMMQAVKPRVEEKTAATAAYNPYGAPQPQPQAAAGFGIRLAAYLVDAVWILALYAGAYFAGKSLGPELAMGLAAAAVFLVVLFGWAIWGTTPGKRAFHLYVTAGSGGGAGIGFPRALARMIGYVVSAVPLGLGFWMILSASRRGLHDLIAGTRVERQA